MDNRILVIDDIRTYEGAVHARTAAEGIKLLQKQEWDEVWLDHDLGYGHTIRPVLDWLAEHQLDVHVLVITASEDGQREIVNSLRGKYRIMKATNGVGTHLKMLRNV